MEKKEIRMIRKQYKLILILALCVAVLIGAYFVIAPLLEEPEEVKAEFDKDGDRLGTSERPYIFDVIENEKVASIFVKNELDSYRLNKDERSGSFVLEGGEDLILDAEKLSYLYVCTCNLLAMAKVDDPSDDLSTYGLEKGKNGNYFEVTDTDGKIYTVYIGDLLPTGAAYYCKYEDKPHIYVLSTMLNETVLSARTAYVSPLLCAPVPKENYYQIENLKIIKNGKLFVEFERETEETQDENSLASSHRMIYPAQYNPTGDLDGLLSTFINPTGARVVEVGLNEQNTDKYGIRLPSAEIRFTYDGIERMIIVGGTTEDGLSYYAYNPSHDTIIEVPKQTLYYLEWDMIKYVSSMIFQMKIDSVKTFEIKADGIDKVYSFEGEKNELVITDTSTGKPIDTESFRQFYIDVLMTSVVDYSEVPDPLDLYASFCITTKSGAKYDYRFYDLTTRRCYYTINGVGEFCVNRDDVTKMITNITKVINGESFRSEVLN